MPSLPDISRKIRKSPAVRVLAYPYVQAWSMVTRYNYYRSKDYVYLKSLKNAYQGKRCFIIGNGPSLTGEDLDSLKDEVTFASNRIYSMFDRTSWRPDFYMVADAEKLLTEKENIERLDCPVKFVMKVLSIKPIRFKKDPSLHRIIQRDKYCFRNRDFQKKSINTDCARGFSKSESVTQRMIELAIYMGFSQIYLLGCDNNYPVVIRSNGTVSVDKSVVSHFKGGEVKKADTNYIYLDASDGCYQTYKDYADAHDIRIFNATRGGKLEVFQRVALEDALNKDTAN